MKEQAAEPVPPSSYPRSILRFAFCLSRLSNLSWGIPAESTPKSSKYCITVYKDWRHERMQAFWSFLRHMGPFALHNCSLSFLEVCLFCLERTCILLKPISIIPQISSSLATYKMATVTVHNQPPYLRALAAWLWLLAAMGGRLKLSRWFPRTFGAPEGGSGRCTPWRAQKRKIHRKARKTPRLER